MSTFTNKDFTFNGGTFNQVAGDLHNGDVKHIHGQLINSNNRNSNNVTGSNNTIGSNNTSSPRAHPYRGYYDTGRNYGHHQPSGLDQRPPYQRARGRRGRGSRRGRQPIPESSQREHRTASESGSGPVECDQRRPYPIPRQPSQRAASGGPRSPPYRSDHGGTSTYMPSRSSSQTSRPSARNCPFPPSTASTPHPVSDEGYGSPGECLTSESEDGPQHENEY
ncbi:hypothetical protein BD779DRAFT_1567119 [Infundibulicybe gibba]|nr:hypothetical protein BD779DRAFT_1567119 [Infundibulicybe gibba]